MKKDAVQTADSLPAPAATEAVTAETAAVATAGSPRPPKTPKAKAPKTGGKKSPAPQAPAKPAATKPAAKPAKQKASKPAKAAKPAKGLSAMGAAAQVLAASKTPLNVKQIVAAMSEQGLWTSPGGKTPHATLAAALQRDIAAKGRESKFKKVDRGLYAASGRGA